ncbi:MAG TPA: phage baseplate assembly protein V [Xanthobacteraceae bacterium]|nr:phage baseplate assembly protein V [Xanthobacteraceae bacterium]
MVDWLNIIRREIARFQTRHNRKMVGFIDSYNPNDHTAKVKFPTELDVDGNPRITGWMPFQAQAGGAGASWVIGPAIGDQCTVEHLEGDSEAGVITGFLHNTVDTPPNAASGQAILRHTQSGNYFTLNPDGSFQWVHKATGNYHKLRKDGSAATYISSTSQQHYIGGDPDEAGTFSPVATVAGPSPYAQARIS